MVPNGMVVWFSYTSTSQHVFRALFGQLVFSGKFLQQDPSPTLDLSHLSDLIRTPGSSFICRSWETRIGSLHSFGSTNIAGWKVAPGMKMYFLFLNGDTRVSYVSLLEGKISQATNSDCIVCLQSLLHLWSNRNKFSKTSSLRPFRDPKHLGIGSCTQFFPGGNKEIQQMSYFNIENNSNIYILKYIQHTPKLPKLHIEHVVFWMVNSILQFSCKTVS